MNRLHNSVKVQKHFGIPETEHLEPLSLEKLGAAAIELRPGGMLTAVELDDEASLQTTEIHDEGRHWMLSPELGTPTLTRSEALPQAQLGVGLIVPQPASKPCQPHDDRRGPAS